MEQKKWKKSNTGVSGYRILAVGLFIFRSSDSSILSPRIGPGALAGSRYTSPARLLSFPLGRGGSTSARILPTVR
jgi:hypothetical protein